MDQVKNTAIGAVKSKTVWLGAIVTILGAIQTQVDLVALLGDQTAGIVLSVIGVAVVVLRALTNTALSDK